MPQGGYKQSQPMCHKPQGNRPDHRASRPSQSIDHKSDALGAHLPLQHKIKHSQLSTQKCTRKSYVLSNRPINSYMQAFEVEAVCLIFSIKQTLFAIDSTFKSKFAIHFYFCNYDKY